MREESKDAKPVVHGDRNDPLASHALAVVARFGSIAGLETAAEEIHENRQPFLFVLGRRPDIECQTVFAHAAIAEVHIAEQRVLHATVAELFGIEYAFPFRCRSGRCEAKLADWGLGERYAAENANARGLLTFEGAERSDYL
jgi:hypothetical protein